MRLVSLVALTSVFVPQPAAAAPDRWQPFCKAAAAYSDAHRGVSVLVLQDGKAVCEHYLGGDAATPYELWSGTKSFIGLLAAAAVQDGMLKLDEAAADTITEWRGDPVRSKITLRQLLSMASGQPSIMGRPPTYADALNVPLSAAPGEKFMYGATPLQTFGEIMRRKLVARGLPGDLDVYLQRRILSPIGLKYAAWRRGADGHVLTPQGITITAREWAKLGELVRAGGRAGEKQLVDPVAFAEMFKPSPANPAYGLTWWLPHPSKVPDPITAETDIGRNADSLPDDLVEAAGAGDQRLYVIPSLKLTIVRQAQLDLVALAAGKVSPSGWSDSAFLKILLSRPK